MKGLHPVVRAGRESDRTFRLLCSSLPVQCSVGALVALGAAKARAGALYGISFVDPMGWSAAIVDPSTALRAD